MLDPTQYDCLAGALRDALDRWPNETCLIEGDREKEKARLTYRQFKDAALPLARALQDSGFSAEGRSAIIMTNQSKWLISAFAIFYCGGVLVPLDYKLAPEEHWQLLAHSKSQVLIIEFHIWRLLAQSPASRGNQLQTILVTEAPLHAQLARARR